MKRFLHSLLLSFFLIAIAGTAAPAWAARGGGGHAGASHGGHGFHGHSGHGHSHVSFGFGLGFYGPWYPYSWPYYYPASYWPYYYDAPASYVSAADAYPATQYPMASAEPQQPQEAPAWYYCASLKGYYPYVSQCPEQWQRVPTVPPPGSDNRRRYD